MGIAAAGVGGRHGISNPTDAWVYAFFGLGAIGAASAMLQTIIRGKSGDDIDAAKL